MGKPVKVSGGLCLPEFGSRWRVMQVSIDKYWRLLVSIGEYWSGKGMKCDGYLWHQMN